MSCQGSFVSARIRRESAVVMLSPCLSLLLWLGSCTATQQEAGKPAPQPAAIAVGPASSAPHLDEPEHAEFPTRVRLSDEVVAQAGIRTAKVAREALMSTVDLPGELVADPDRSARVSSPIAGRIERVLFKEGSRVEKGALLAVIRVPELGKVRATYAATLAQAKAARAQAKRLSGLVAQRLASEQAVLDAEATATGLELEAEAAKDRLGALGLGVGDTPRGKSAPSLLSLTAPLAGTVLTRAAVVGQPVTSEQVIAEIVDLSEVWFLGRVFEKDLGRLQTGAPAEVLLNAYPSHVFDGEVDYLGQQVDPIARTLTTRIRLTNREGLLRLGLFGTARVSTRDASRELAQDQGVLVVPRSALTRIADKELVFVRQPDADFELHEVVVGASAAGKVQIVSGLREGEQVVIDGVFTLKSSVLKSTLSEDE